MGSSAVLMFKPQLRTRFFRRLLKVSDQRKAGNVRQEP